MLYGTGADMLGVMTAGCEPVLTTEEIVKAAREAVTELNTYQFNIDRVLTFTSEDGQANYLVGIYGAVDEIERKMHHILHISLKHLGIPVKTTMRST